MEFADGEIDDWNVRLFRLSASGCVVESDDGAIGILSSGVWFVAAVAPVTLVALRFILLDWWQARRAVGTMPTPQSPQIPKLVLKVDDLAKVDEPQAAQPAPVATVEPQQRRPGPRPQRQRVLFGPGGECVSCEAAPRANDKQQHNPLLGACCSGKKPSEGHRRQLPEAVPPARAGPGAYATNSTTGPQGVWAFNKSAGANTQTAAELDRPPRAGKHYNDMSMYADRQPLNRVNSRVLNFELEPEPEEEQPKPEVATKKRQQRKEANAADERVHVRHDEMRLIAANTNGVVATVPKLEPEPERAPEIDVSHGEVIVAMLDTTGNGRVTEAELRLGIERGELSSAFGSASEAAETAERVIEVYVPQVRACMPVRDLRSRSRASTCPAFRRSFSGDTPTGRR